MGGFTTNIDRWQFINFTPPAFVRLDVGGMETGRGARERDRGRSPVRAGQRGHRDAQPERYHSPKPGGPRTTLWAQAHNFRLDEPLVTDIVVRADPRDL